MSVFAVIVNDKKSETIDDHDLEQVDRIGRNEYFVISDNRSFHGIITDVDLTTKRVTLEVNGRQYMCRIEEPLDITIRSLNLNSHSKQLSKDLISSMPGLVLNILVTEGQEVQAGDPLMILEAMKMENILKASFSGTVNRLCCQPGEAVDKGQLLIEIIG